MNFDMSLNNMHIGFDAKRIVANGTGLGSYGRNLVNAMAQLPDCPRLTLYAPDPGRDDLRGQVVGNGHVEFAYSGHSLRLMKDWWRARGIVADLGRDGIDIYHGLSGELPKGARAAGVKTIVTIHDLIFMRHPEYYKWIDVQLYKRKFYRTLREADRIVAISECTRRDILHYSDYPADRISVVYQGCGTAFDTEVPAESIAHARQKYALPPRYILNVGTIEERKNMLLAVKALEELPSDVTLVMVGRATAYTQRVLDHARSHGLAHRVMTLHGVPNADLPAIYRAASLFVYPSRYEGFGIPIIEAIQSGLPVVAASGSCLEEAGGPDCLYVHPDDHHAMAEAVARLLGDEALRQRAVARSREYVRRFENADVARDMLEAYKKL